MGKWGHGGRGDGEGEAAPSSSWWQRIAQHIRQQRRREARADPELRELPTSSSMLPWAMAAEVAGCMHATCASLGLSALLLLLPMAPTATESTIHSVDHHLTPQICLTCDCASKYLSNCCFDSVHIFCRGPPLAQKREHSTLLIESMRSVSTRSGQSHPSLVTCHFSL